MMMMMMMMMMRHRPLLSAIVAGNAINPENVVRDTGLEFHPGAVRYDREIGIWPES